MAIGYACLTIGNDDIKYRTCRISNATPDNLFTIIRYNLNSLEKAIDYNSENNIKLFRISSDIIPFGSNPNITIDWQKKFLSKLRDIGKKIREYNIRVSMHPGQYTVLNSPNDNVVKNAVNDLKYHADFLDSIGTDKTSKIILHIGGVYGDKAGSISRFIKNFKKLDNNIKSRISIENDDKSYNIMDVLSISKVLDLPVVYDNLHNSINPFDNTKDDIYWINMCTKTWKKVDGNQKIHYSQQATNKKLGSHSPTIDLNEFINFYNRIKNFDLDIMLEVKDKDKSAIKCIKEVNKDNM
jgi:UV DNA damage endonuclease